MTKTALSVLALAAVTGAPLAAQEAEIWVRTSSASVVEELANLYNASHDGQITVVPVVAEQMVPKLGTAIAGGVGPAAAALDLIYLPTFAAAGALEDITAYIDALPFADALSPSHVRLGTYGGAKHAVPLMPDASIIAYNTDLFEAAGIDPSEALSTVEGMRDAAIAIAALEDDAAGFYFVSNSGSWMIYDFLPHIWAAGQDILSEDGRSETVDTPAMRATLEAYNAMFAAGAIHPTSRSGNGNSAVEAFAAGDVGILMSGSYIVNLLTASYPDVNFGIAPIPGPGGGAATFAGGDAVALVTGVPEDQKALVLDFISFYLEPEQQVLITELAGMPSRTDLAAEAYSNFDPRNLIAYDVLAAGRTPYTYASNELFVSLTGPFLNLTNAAIFDGQIDSAIATAAQGFAEILTRTNPAE